MVLEIEKNNNQIEVEVNKRLAIIKAKLEKDMYDELERLKQIEYKKQLEKEV